MNIWLRSEADVSEQLRSHGQQTISLVKSAIIPPD